MNKVPSSENAERAVLGALLKSEELLADVVAVLPVPECFRYPNHQTVYRTLLMLHSCQEPLDLVFVANELENQGKLIPMGGRTFLVGLIDDCPMVSRAGEYAETVGKKWELRRIIEVAESLASRASDSAAEPVELIARASESLVQVTTKVHDRTYRPLSDFAMEVLDTIDKAQSSGRRTGIETGYTDLDAMTGGLQNGELIFVAARPSMGKTALMSCLASNQATKGHSVGIFSAETKGAEFALRSLCTHAKVDSMAVKTGKLGKSDFDRLAHALNVHAGWKIWLEDTPGVDINRLLAQAARMVEENGAEIIYVDYLQKLTSSQKFQSQRERTDYCVVALKRMAQIYDIPVVVLCQLNRNLESRQNKTPLLADLKESGMIEQEGDTVIALHRPSKYIKKKGAGEKKAENLNECHILKQRNGPEGKIDLWFDPIYTLFENMALEREELPF